MSLTSRWLAGGDKYESTMADYFAERLHEARVLEEEQKETLRAVVSTWTENNFDARDDHMLQRFLEVNPEWDHEALYDTIDAEMTRIIKLMEEESA